MSTEKKTINYNGMELECIKSGYWPDGVTLVLHDGNITSCEVRDAVCLRSGSVLRANGSFMTGWRFWAILPPKPAPRRLTNRELFNLCQKGYAVRMFQRVQGHWNYLLEEEGSLCSNFVDAVRAPNTDEWLEPTSDLLEAGK